MNEAFLDALSDRIDDILSSHFGPPPFGDALEHRAVDIAGLLLDGKLVLVTADRRDGSVTLVTGRVAKV